MNMPVEPGIPYYMSYHELDPSNQRQCIFIAKSTQKRCRWPCHIADNEDAITLRKQINAEASKLSALVSLDLLQEYILCNCCKSGRAQHQDRIRRIKHLEPLAERWQQEIRNRVFDSRRASAYSLGQNLHNISSIASETPETQPIMHRILNVENEHTIETSTIQRYNLRPRCKAPLLEFVPNLREQHHTVAFHLLRYLDPEEYDFRTGSLYMFSRDASPGHVKIGWTSHFVRDRLAQWSLCGYTPNLLHSADNVPNAHRAEALVHHELIEEWRREGICKGCGISHEEWFEISPGPAKRVIDEWANFFKKAKPYDSSTGQLKDEWRKVAQAFNVNREPITARKLLDQYEALAAQQEASLAQAVDALQIDGNESSSSTAPDDVEATLAEQLDALALQEVQPASPQERPTLPDSDLDQGTLLLAPIAQTKEVKFAPEASAQLVPRTEFTFTTRCTGNTKIQSKANPSGKLGFLTQACMTQACATPEPALQGRAVSESVESLPPIPSTLKATSAGSTQSTIPGSLLAAFKDAAERDSSSKVSPNGEEIPQAAKLPKSTFTFTCGRPSAPDPTAAVPASQLGWLFKTQTKLDLSASKQPLKENLSPEITLQKKVVSKAAAGLPLSKFTFEVKSPVKRERSGIEGSMPQGWLFGALAQVNSSASKDLAGDAASTDPNEGRTAPGEETEQLLPEDIPLPPSPDLNPTLPQLTPDLSTTDHHSATSEPEAESDSEESDDETSATIDDDTLFDHDVETSGTGICHEDEALVESAIQVSVQRIAAKAVAEEAIAIACHNAPVVEEATVPKALDVAAGLGSETAVTVQVTEVV